MVKLKPLFIINIIIALFLAGLLLFTTFRFGPYLTRFVSDPQRFREYILSFGPWSTAIFIGFQMLQVVIAIIPGEPIQIAGGYIFGVFWGTLYSTIGITAGYIIVFIGVKFFGFPLVKALVPEKELNKFTLLMNNPKLEATIFLLFLLPGIPKDILVYIAGLTPVRPFLFFVIITIARLPAMIGSSYIGAKIQTSEYVAAITLSLLASILFVTGYIFKEKIIRILHERVWTNKGANESKKV